MIILLHMYMRTIGCMGMRSRRKMLCFFYIFTNLNPYTKMLPCNQTVAYKATFWLDQYSFISESSSRNYLSSSSDGSSFFRIYPSIFRQMSLYLAILWAFSMVLIPFNLSCFLRVATTWTNVINQLGFYVILTFILRLDLSYWSS